MIAIRTFQAGDAEPLAELFAASVRALAHGDYTDAQIRAWASAIADVDRFALRAREKMTWVAVRESRIAGFSDLEPDGHIDMLYVHPEHARRGVARALLAHIEGIAADHAPGRLYTEASITARPVFERMGFEVTAQQTVTVRGESMMNYRMEKSLRPAR